jgi:hypothetical protein
MFAALKLKLEVGGQKYENTASSDIRLQTSLKRMWRNW